MGMIGCADRMGKMLRGYPGLGSRAGMRSYDSRFEPILPHRARRRRILPIVFLPLGC